jgi:hypothetical protein
MRKGTMAKTRRFKNGRYFIIFESIRRENKREGAKKRRDKREGGEGNR